MSQRDRGRVSERGITSVPSKLNSNLGLPTNHLPAVTGRGGEETGVAAWNIACAAAKSSLPCFLRQNWYHKGEKIEETRREIRVR